MEYLVLIYNFYRDVVIGETGFYISLKYFENFDIISWFQSIRNVPWIFINVLCFIDRNLALSLDVAVKQGLLKPRNKRAYYKYLILNGQKLFCLPDAVGLL